MSTGRGPAVIDAFLEAIDLEIEAILTGSTADAIRLRRGVRTGEDGGEFEYVFPPVPTPNVTRRSLIRAAGRRGRWEPAVAAPLQDGRIRITTRADLGHDPISAQLREDDTAPLEQLAERISSAASSASGINPTTAGLVLGHGTPRLARIRDVAGLIEGYRGLPLNDRQREAIERALASDVTFIWGPPGTGKTEVVSRIVQGTLRQGLRVLFLSPTHVAVDQALERICALLEQEDGFGRGLVQRAGDIASPSLQARFGDAISQDRIVERTAQELVLRCAELNAQLDTVRTRIALHARFAEAQDRLDRSSSRCASAEQRAADADAALRRSTEQLWSAQQERRALGSSVGLFAQRRQRRIEALDAEIRARHVVAQQARADLDQAMAELLARRTDQRSAADERRACGDELTAVEPLDRLRHHEQRLENELAQVEKARREVVDAVRARCRVMAATVQKAVQSRSLMESVDVVVMDEAGMVALPRAWCAAGMAEKRVVMAGDFRQLSAVTRGSDNRAATTANKRHSRLWMDRDAFSAAGLVGADGAARPDARMVCLDTQYRMRSAICAVVNEVAYPDAPLRTGREESRASPHSPLLPGPLVLVDTSSRRMQVGGPDAHKSNAVHEAVIHELIRGLQYDRVLPARKVTAPSAADRMAVIAPYRDQANALRKSVRYRFGTDYDGFVDTVHRFQGSQRAIVVVDTVAGAGSKLGVLYEGTGLSSQTCRLLNVTLSRAQDHLVVIADVDFLRMHVTADSEVSKLLSHLRRHAAHLSVDDLVPVRSAAELTGLPKEDLDRPAFFPADEVPRAVAWDIARARETIDVYCAFLDRQPVRRWLRELAAPLAAGVRVTVHTRPHEAGTTAAALMQELVGAGCRVEARERMHEKVVIVDETILWHGSLNLLANVGPTDLMMRFTDPTACARVQRIISTARMERPARTWNGNGAGRPGPAGQGVRPGEVVDGRLYLNVSYAEKDEAKRLGARWDPQRRLWHVAANTPREQVARWLSA